MFYGRVDVYWPTGPMESYRLNKPTIAIGRSPGNDIVLDTTAISRYHITLTFQNQQVALNDLESVNGTYVDSVRLTANEPYLLRGGEEIQIGDIRLIFHPPAEETEQITDTTQRVVLSQPSYRVELDGPDMPVAPGAHVQAILKIENLSETTDRYFVEIDGLTKGWARIDRVEMEIGPSEPAQAMISFKPLRRSESLPGDYPFVVHVRSKSNPTQTIDAPAVLHVLPYSGFGMAIGESQVNSSDSFKLYVHNQGNAPLSLAIRGSDSARALSFQLPKTTIVLEPGERQTLVGTIKPRRRKLFGQDHEHEFALMVRAQDASGFLAAVPGTYVEKGLLPVWAPVLAVPLVALALVVIVGLVLLSIGNDSKDDQPDIQPFIDLFSVSSPAVVLGEAVQVNWTVTGAETVSLFSENSTRQQVQYPVEVGATSQTVTFDHTGLFALVLEARQGQAVSYEKAVVEVRPIVTLNLEVLDGTELVRNVQYDVRVSWTVQGAKEFDNGYQIRLDSSEGGTLIDAPLPLSGYRDIQIVPQGEQVEWLVTLYADGYDNVTASVTQKLPIVYSSCELIASKTVVRSGPGEAYPAIVPPLESSAEGNLSLSPLARDPSSNWLLVHIGVDNPRPGWVPRQDFSCANFDPDRLIPSTDFPPPPATAAPTEDVTPTTP